MSGKELRLASEIQDEDVSINFLKKIAKIIFILSLITSLIISLLIWSKNFRQDSVFSPQTGKMEQKAN